MIYPAPRHPSWRIQAQMDADMLCREFVVGKYGPEVSQPWKKKKMKILRRAHLSAPPPSPSPVLLSAAARVAAAG